MGILARATPVHRYVVVTERSGKKILKRSQRCLLVPVADKEEVTMATLADVARCRSLSFRLSAELRRMYTQRQRPYSLLLLVMRSGTLLG